ncbi:hypothetical protein G7Y89_g2182 [Cudoniella acicularis]|uniref:Uncharacterized protein n=1 Tax=Cudoniella acicularis TaxID=354080 RepID=A0A8H4RTT9_9HELO|nr:hypothetical protein G7Y89_g2182 [Cudoniella acicularis]
MGINIDIFQALPQGGLVFNVLSACNAEKVNLSEACTVQFDSSNEFQSIGNISKGNLTAEPGIAGMGVWIGTAYTLLVILAVFGVVAFEYAPRWVFGRILKQNSRGHMYVTRPIWAFSDPQDNESKFRQAIRSLVLGIADTQMVLVIAQTLNFVTLGKCSLSAYHFRAAIDAMLISFSCVVLSVAAVRSYWRSKPTAILRLIFSIGIYICISIVIYSGTSYATDWPPPTSTNDSLIVFPVACLLENDLFAEVQSRLDKQPNAMRGSIDSLAFPVEIVFLDILGPAFAFAHLASIVRRGYGRHGEGNNVVTIWINKWHGILAAVYWSFVTIPPTAIAIWCWVKIGQARYWVSNSGWQGNPNPEDSIWDTGQLVPLLSFILFLVSVSNTVWERKIQKNTEQPELDDIELLPRRHGERSPLGQWQTIP